jgi:hypothetical protein
VRLPLRVASAEVIDGSAACTVSTAAGAAILRSSGPMMRAAAVLHRAVCLCMILVKRRKSFDLFLFSLSL